MELKGKKLLATTILSLLVLGSLGYNALPEAYCPLEDKTVKYVHISDSKKTVTKVIPEGESWKILDDRCQKGREIGQWIEIDQDLAKKRCPDVNIIAYTDDGKWFCDDIGIDANCIKDETLELPI